MPDNYTKAVSDNKRYAALGNSWTCPVIEHILENLKKKIPLKAEENLNSTIKSLEENYQSAGYDR